MSITISASIGFSVSSITWTVVQSLNKFVHAVLLKICHSGPIILIARMCSMGVYLKGWQK